MLLDRVYLLLTYTHRIRLTERMLVPLLQDRLFLAGQPGSSIPLPPSDPRAPGAVSLLGLPFRQATKNALVDANMGRTWVSFHKTEPDWLGVRLILERARTWGVRLSATTWQMLVKAGMIVRVSWLMCSPRHRRVCLFVCSVNHGMPFLSVFRLVFG